jgi:hypothetical protein
MPNAHHDVLHIGLSKLDGLGAQDLLQAGTRAFELGAADARSGLPVHPTAQTPFRR